MKIKTLVSVTLLCLGFLANAPAPVVSQAYEVALSDFRAPANQNGTAAFKPCSSCQHKVVRVTGATRYQLNGKSVRLDEFRKVINQANGGDVIVLHHLESNTIKSISVSL